MASRDDTLEWPPRHERAKMSTISQFGLSDRWFYGDCRFFAQELKKKLGRDARLVGLVSRLPKTLGGLEVRVYGYDHVFVLHDSKLWDACGAQTGKEAIARWRKLTRRPRAKLWLEPHDHRKWRNYKRSISHHLGLPRPHSTVDGKHVEAVRRLARRDAKKMLDVILGAA